MFQIPAIFSSAVVRKAVTLQGGSGITTDYNLIDDAFGGVAPSKKAIVTITVDDDYVVVGSAPGTPAMDLTGLPANSQIILVNNGFIIGAGGGGGAGGNCNAFLENSVCEQLSAFGGIAGSSGGNAISYDGSGVDLTIHNADGKIFGGGGGGGGGSATRNLSICSGNAGGGGGGGAGGYDNGVSGGAVGIGGAGGTFTDAGVEVPLRSGEDGNDGPTGVSGGNASGGAGGGGGGVAAGGAGGAGGDFGEDGSAGADGNMSGGGGGSAGKAVGNSGDGSTTFSTGGVEGTDYKGAVE